MRHFVSIILLQNLLCLANAPHPYPALLDLTSHQATSFPDAFLQEHPALMLLIDADTITYVNEAYCRFFGKTRAELEGTPFLDLMPQAARAPFLDRTPLRCDG